ncbi:MAG TPA: sulfite exporter TauE/SafE family protein [Caulobacteraceae bacterium]|jgi:hypothetical protein|nr:sulfite exporter TauE/SafE family protein [Caulobacteraceae bacterium]
MDLIHHLTWTYALAGLLVSFMVGFTGVGGGSLMTPLLVLVFHIHPAAAVGTDLFYAGATRIVGAAVHGVRRTVDWAIVTRLAAGSVPAAAITVAAMAHFHVRTAAGSHGVITTMLGVSLILTGLAILLRRIILAFMARRMGEVGQRTKTISTVVLGAALGVLVSISSVGAGAIGVTVLLLLYPALPASKLVGSDIAHAVPLTLLAGFGYWLMGSVDFALLASLLVGSIPGIIAGSLLSSRAPDSVLRPILASTLALVGGRLFF